MAEKGTLHTFTDEELERGEAMMARLREVEAALVDDTGQTASSEQLLPCPFCGGHATSYGTRKMASGGSTHCLIHCDECSARLSAETEAEAVSAWNCRAERTCRDTDYDTGSITCSECGEITRNTLFWAEVDGGWTVKGHRPRFCSNCGARMVSER